jgi:hypothetical protein
VLRSNKVRSCSPASAGLFLRSSPGNSFPSPNSLGAATLDHYRSQLHVHNGADLNSGDGFDKPNSGLAASPPGDRGATQALHRAPGGKRGETGFGVENATPVHRRRRLSQDQHRFKAKNPHTVPCEAGSRTGLLGSIINEPCPLSAEKRRQNGHSKSPPKCHVWTAPSWQGKTSRRRLGRCSHVSACLRGSHDRWP